jgi:hypothetical protein
VFDEAEVYPDGSNKMAKREEIADAFKTEVCVCVCGVLVGGVTLMSTSMSTS